MRIKKNMRYSMQDLHWNVYTYDFNAKKIVIYDIFNHGTFEKELNELEYSTYEEFKENLKHLLMYYFWSKCEWEIILSAWPPTDDMKEATKIDVYNQVLLNWDVFCDYVWRSTHD